MRTLLWGACVGVALAWTNPARPDDTAEMKKLLDRASAALGGEAKIAKLKGVTQKGKGTLHFVSMKAPFEETSYWHVPDKFRFDLALDLNGQKVHEQIVINGAKAWVKINDTTADLPKDLATSFRDVFYAMTFAMRPMDAKGKDFKLSPLGEIKVGDRDAVGIQISFKGKPDVNLYLDKKTGLPAKCDVRSQDGFQANKEVVHELVFSDYKKFGELQTFTKLLWNRDGNKYVERETAEVKTEESLDGDLFAKP